MTTTLTTAQVLREANAVVQQEGVTMRCLMVPSSIKLQGDIPRGGTLFIPRS